MSISCPADRVHLSQGVSLPTEEPVHRAAESGVGERYLLRPNGAAGFMYLVAILDWYSRRVLAWRVSNTFDSDFCVEALKLEDALIHYGPPADLQYGPRRSVHVPGVYDGATKPMRIGHQHAARDAGSTNTFVERLWRSVKYEDVYRPC